jgi:WhiB family transcriptional regulator, redox-sensing transcriptional regulator
MSDWRTRAACRGHDPEIWFESSAEAAKRICRNCPVQQQCLESALHRGETVGVWGGHQFTREGTPSRRGVYQRKRDAS